jgi:polysaccharide biosynthesis protein PslH
VQALARRVEVCVLAVGEDSAAGDLEELGVRRVERFARASALQIRATALARGWPVGAARFWSEAAHRFVNEASDSGAIVVIDFLHTAVLRPERAPYVFSAHNVEADLAKQLRPNSLRHRVEAMWNIRTIARLERSVAADPLATRVAVSRSDAERLRAHAVVSNGAPKVDAVTPVPAVGTVIFVGSLSYAPNADAVAWWRDEIAPLVRSRLQLTVAGFGAPADFDMSGLDYRGAVADLADLYREAALVVVPLRQGSGSRIKILEAFAHGRPVLSTMLGAAGLDLVPGNQFVAADTPADFAERVDELLSDLPKRRELARRGQQVALARSWESVGDLFAQTVLGRR